MPAASSAGNCRFRAGRELRGAAGYRRCRRGREIEAGRVRSRRARPRLTPAPFAVPNRRRSGRGPRPPCTGAGRAGMPNRSARPARPLRRGRGARRSSTPRTARSQPSSEMMIAAAPRQYWCAAMMVLPPSRSAAPRAHARSGSTSNCVNSACSSVARAAIEAGTMQKKGPSALAKRWVPVRVLGRPTAGRRQGTLRLGAVGRCVAERAEGPCPGNGSMTDLGFTTRNLLRSRSCRRARSCAEGIRRSP